MSDPKCLTVLQGRCHCRCLEGGTTHIARGPPAVGAQTWCGSFFRDTDHATRARSGGLVTGIGMLAIYRAPRCAVPLWMTNGPWSCNMC